MIYYLIKGYGSSVAPTYINEISPSNLRGTLGASFQLGIVVLVFISQIVSLESVLGSGSTWHYALGKHYLKKHLKDAFFVLSVGLSIVFCILQIILLFFIPESPKFLLLKKNNPVGAEKG